MRLSPLRRPAVLGPLVVMALVAACGDDHLAPATSPTATSAPAAGTTTAGTTGPAITDPAPTTLLPAGAVEVVRWAETGGCMVLGPNCPTWTVASDGTVEVSRTLAQPGVDTSVAATGHVDASLLADVVREARAVDAPTLLAELGPGTCNSCVDGADVVVTITDGDRTLVLDSVDLAFDPGHPLFAALDRLMATVRLVELPLVSAA